MVHVQAHCQNLLIKDLEKKVTGIGAVANTAIMISNFVRDQPWFRTLLHNEQAKDEKLKGPRSICSAVICSASFVQPLLTLVFIACHQSRHSH